MKNVTIKTVFLCINLIIIEFIILTCISFAFSFSPFSFFPSFLSISHSIFSIARSLCVNNQFFNSHTLDQITIILSIHGRVPTMSSLLSRLSPIPAFPAYTGPYHVGTQEVEIPISDLPTSSPPPDANITTVSFRIFYPCQPSKPKPAYWLPSPQGEYFRAYARFLSAGPRLASFLRLVIWQVQGIQDIDLMPFL